MDAPRRKQDEHQHSFTSFRPLSPEASKGVFTFSFPVPRFFTRKKDETSQKIPNDKSRKQDLRVTYQAPPKTGLPKLSHTPGQSRPRPPPWGAADLHMPRGRSSPLLNRRPDSGPKYYSGYTRPSATSPFSDVQNSSAPGYRNLTAVLRQLSVLAGGQEYKEDDFKQYWMLDEDCKECYECGEKFNPFRRRHHCRLCGQIFCYRCCYLEIPGQLMGYTGGLRVCNYCYKIVQSYTQELDMARNLEHIQADLRAVSMDSGDLTAMGANASTKPKSSGFPFEFDDDESFFHHTRRPSTGSTHSAYYERMEKEMQTPMQTVRSPFDAFGVCAAEADLLKQDSLRDLWHKIMSPRSGLELQSHRFRLKTYNNCLVGSELVDWLLTYEKAPNRSRAVVISQALLDSGWLEAVPNTREGTVFKDEYILYQPGQSSLREIFVKPRGPSLLFSKADLVDDNGSNDVEEEDSDETVPQWFRQLSEYGSDFENSESVEVSLDTTEAAETDKQLGGRPASLGKQLDLDITGRAQEVEESSGEMSLQMNLDHFGEKKGTEQNGKSKVPNNEAKKPRLPLITGAPPPPLEQYVYSEGYPHSPLRPGGNKKANDTVAVVVGDEILNGAMIAKKIGVDRPSSPEPNIGRDENGEKLAMDRLKVACQYHLTRLSEQLLRDAALSLEWKDTFLPLVLRVSDKVAPNVRKDDDMDIRQYVKFKKITGGKKSDCQFYSGIVLTKNISNKKMASTLSNPKILVLSCAIDYQRNENRLASLDPLVLQEHNFLKNFVSRVAALRPNILLVEKTVSRIAQDMLLQHGITLALNVKPQVLERVARCTKADILLSMEQLTRPQLGTCQHFTVQKFLLKNGDTKTLMFFDGCPPELGCTVTLRGGNSVVLAKVKKIMKHLVYVAYNLKLELQFLMDEFALPPSPRTLVPKEDDSNDIHQPPKISTSENNLNQTNTEQMDGKGLSSLDCNNTMEQELKAKMFQKALDQTILSSSPYVVYPLPYLLSPEGQTCGVRSILPKEVYWSFRLLPSYRKNPVVKEDEYEEVDTLIRPRERKRSKNVVVLPPHPLISAILTRSSTDKEVQSLFADFRAQGGTIQLRNRVGSKGRVSCPWYNFKSIDFMARGGNWMEENTAATAPFPDAATREQKTNRRPEVCKDLPQKNLASSGLNERGGAVESAFPAVERLKTEPQLRQAEIYEGIVQQNDQKQEEPQSVHKNPIHFGRKVDCLNPYNHQRIAVLFSSYSSESNNSPRPCISPWAVFMEFYGRNDITLGGFLERYCFRPSYICPNPNCDVPMVNHVRYFAHGTGSVYINMRNLESPIPGFQHTILTWSWCKECKQVTPIVPLSSEAWAMSFAKYLELRFYAHSYTRRASIEQCGHSLHRDHYQYFAYANMVASFKYRAIKLFEAFIPPPWISVKVSKREASYWISDVQALSTRGDSVFVSIMDRIESLKTDIQQTPEREAKINQFVTQLEADQTKFIEHIKAVQNKAASLKETHNPLAVDCEENGPEQLDAREREAMDYVIADSLNGLKRILCETVESWNSRFQELIQAEKKKIVKSSPIPAREGKTAAERCHSMDTLATAEGMREDSTDSTEETSLSQEVSPGITLLSSSSSSPYPVLGQSTDKPSSLDATVATGENETVVFEVGMTEGVPGRFVGKDGVVPSSIEAEDMWEVVERAASSMAAEQGSSSDLPPGLCTPQFSSLGDLKPKTSDQLPVTMRKGNSMGTRTKSGFKKGHRRVVSMPPKVTVTSTEGVTKHVETGDEVQGTEGKPGAETLERRRSESDPSTAEDLQADAGQDSGLSVKDKNEEPDDVTPSVDPESNETFNKLDGSAESRGIAVKDKTAGTSKSPQTTTKDVFNRNKLGKTLSVPILDGYDHMEGLLLTDGAPAPRRRDKMKHIISSLLTGSTYQPVPTTFPSHEHHLLPPGEKVLVVVSEKEPSSVIAYTLSTKEYNVQLCRIEQYLTRVLSSRTGKDQHTLSASSTSGFTFLEREIQSSAELPGVVLKVGSDSDDDYVSVDLDHEKSQKSTNADAAVSSDEQLEFWQSSMEITADEVLVNGSGRVTYEKAKSSRGAATSEAEKEKDSKRKEAVKEIPETPLDMCKDDKTQVEFGFHRKDDKNAVDFHIKLQFADCCCKFYCSVYYAAQFRNLRKRIFQNGEDRFIRALVHCVPWRARGGKSGSTFSKSLDDRFVMKQMSRLELQSFLEFAPHYFQYINKALDEKRPTLLAKILGVYRIGFRNSQTNATMRQDVLVMENLFYDRKIDKIFDLKGSMRSRYVQSSGTDDVLMDENLLELIREAPIFIRPHSKAVLSRAIHNDTEFLSQHMVMDYSLLVGIDEFASELVIGIIDFIRTFTWDKKLEMYVKSSGILGGQGKMPTVVSPELYRIRFTEAMQRYFLMVPDRWTGLGNELD